jgi:cytoskeletal protein CcmA (bactofilin family)
MNGTVNGDMHARDRLVLGGKARVNGNVYYGVIEMAPGAVITGKLIPLTEGANPDEQAPMEADRDAAVAAAKSGA